MRRICLNKWLGDDIQTSELMDLAWRLLKDDDWYHNPQYPMPCVQCGKQVENEDDMSEGGSGGRPMPPDNNGPRAICWDCIRGNDPVHQAMASGRAKFLGEPELDDPNWQDKIETGEPMDLAWRLLKFQTTLPQFDPTLSEETGYVGVPPVQQYHSATLPDAMKFMIGAQDPHQRMWTEEDPERARRWARGMTQGGPGGAVLGVRGPSPRGERMSPDWSNQPPTEMDALTIPGAELSPQDIVMQRLPTPPSARSMRPRYSDEEIADEKGRQQDALEYLQQIIHDPNISDEEKDAALDNVSARFDLGEMISDDPSFRYNPTINQWELEG
jgi:hypothetical protein